MGRSSAPHIWNVNFSLNNVVQCTCWRYLSLKHLVRLFNAPDITLRFNRGLPQVPRPSLETSETWSFLWIAFVMFRGALLIWRDYGNSRFQGESSRNEGCQPLWSICGESIQLGHGEGGDGGGGGIEGVELLWHHSLILSRWVCKMPLS